MAKLFYSGSGDWDLEKKNYTDSHIAKVLLRCVELLLQMFEVMKNMCDIVHLTTLLT